MAGGRETAYSAEEVLGVVNAAVSGTFLLTQALLPTLRRSSCPDIVTIGSISGLSQATAAMFSEQTTRFRPCIFAR